MNQELISFILPNGLTVVYIQKPGLMTTSLSLRIIGGSIYENLDEIGVAHFLEHIVFAGTLKYPTEKELAELIDERGGIRTGSTNKETVEFKLKVLKEDSEIGFEYLSQIIIHPLVSENNIQKEKKIIEQEINRFKTDPEKFSARLIYSGLFPSTRLGMLNSGDVEDIGKITRENITRYMARTYQAKNMVLVACGDISEGTLKEVVEKYFNDLTPGQKIEPVDVVVSSKEKIIIENRPGIKQATLMLGYQAYKSDSKEEKVLALISSILLRGKSSRLVNEIRDKRALAYAINGAYSNGRNHGIFTIRTGLSEDKIKECIDAVQDVLSKTFSTTIMQDEIDKALAFIKSDMVFNLENPLSLASYYSNMWCSSGKLPSMEEEISEFERISKNPKLLQQVAKEIFSKDPVILAIGANISEKTLGRPTSVSLP